MVLVLALVAAAVYGVVFVLKKVARPTEKKDPFLRVLATASVGTNRFVHVVALGSKAYLVGSGDAGVNLIAEVDDKETVDAMLLDESQRDAEERGPGTLDFKTILRRFSPSSPSNATDTKASVEKLRKRRERIQGL
jgi:flagellar protein FliO/FliZ